MAAEVPDRRRRASLTGITGQDGSSQRTEQGKKISVYGASTKGNTLLQMFSLDHTLIRSAAERNSEKWGKYTAATPA
jgi:hypothetical protein